MQAHILHQGEDCFFCLHQSHFGESKHIHPSSMIWWKNQPEDFSWEHKHNVSASRCDLAIVWNWKWFIEKYFWEEENWNSLSFYRYQYEGKRVEPRLCSKVLDSKVPCHILFHLLPLNCASTWHTCGTEDKGGSHGSVTWFYEFISA